MSVGLNSGIFLAIPREIDDACAVSVFLLGMSVELDPVRFDYSANHMAYRLPIFKLSD
jgi:hypothetical protein